MWTGGKAYGRGTPCAFDEPLNKHEMKVKSAFNDDWERNYIQPWRSEPFHSETRIGSSHIWHAIIEAERTEKSTSTTNFVWILRVHSFTPSRRCATFSTNSLSQVNPHIMFRFLHSIVSTEVHREIFHSLLYSYLWRWANDLIFDFSFFLSGLRVFWWCLFVIKNIASECLVEIYTSKLCVHKGRGTHSCTTKTIHPPPLEWWAPIISARGKHAYIRIVCTCETCGCCRKVKNLSETKNSFEP